MCFDLIPAAIDWERVVPFDPDQWPRAARIAALAGLVVVASAVTHAAVLRGIRAAERHDRLPASIGFALRKVLRWITVVVAGLLLLNVFGLFESVFAALAGVLALIAVGFVAFWSVLSNLLCAMMLLISRPFMIGDRLQFVGDDTSGTVSDFDLLFTTLTLDDGRLLRVPNNLFFQKMFLRSPGEQRKDLAQSLETPPVEAPAATPED